MVCSVIVNGLMIYMGYGLWVLRSFLVIIYYFEELYARH